MTTFADSCVRLNASVTPAHLSLGVNVIARIFDQTMACDVAVVCKQDAKTWG